MYLAFIAGSLSTDQLVKALVRRTPQGSVLFEISRLVRIIHSSNTGVAFGMLSNHLTMLLYASALLIAMLVVVLFRGKHLTYAVRLSLCTLIGGGLSNLFDRLLFGYVTDYVEILLFSFPVFNLADFFITTSVVILIVMTLINRLERKEAER